MDDQNVVTQDPNVVPPQPAQIPQQHVDAGQQGTVQPHIDPGAPVQAQPTVPPVDPSQVQGQAWDATQPAMPGQQYPQQDGQPYPQYPAQQPQQPVIPSGGGISPEVPSAMAPEQTVAPEAVGETLRPAEQAPAAPEQTAEAPKPAPEQPTPVKAPDKAPEQQKFESPFSKVYGYKASPQVAKSSKGNKGRNVSGDVSQAKTWIVILLGRLLRMYKSRS